MTIRGCPLQKPKGSRDATALEVVISRGGGHNGFMAGVMTPWPVGATGLRQPGYKIAAGASRGSRAEMQLLNRAEQFPELQGLLLIAGGLNLGQAAHHLLKLIAGALQLGAPSAGQLQPLCISRSSRVWIERSS